MKFYRRTWQSEATTALRKDLPEELFTRHEWSEDAKGYRESLMPAPEVNVYLSSA